MKSMHNDYNNHFYWGNDFINEQEKVSIKTEIDALIEIDH